MSLRGFRHLRPFQAERERQLPRLERREADGRIDMLLEDPIRLLFRDLLDVHPALRADHQHRAAGRPVENHAEIELPGDLEPFLDEDPAHDASFRAGLMGDERHAQDLLRERLGLVRLLRDFDAAALAAPAGVNLGLDDDRPASETARDSCGLFGRVGDFTARDRYAILRQDLLRLILVNLHRDPVIMIYNLLLESARNALA